MRYQHRPDRSSSKSVEAHRFHEMASPSLCDLGFELVADPSLLLNQYRLTAATYGTARGIYLSVAFDPIDSNSAVVSCGRQWRHRDGGFLLSNRYSVLALRFGIEVPEYYELGYGADMSKTMERILGDLEATLPAVLARVTLDDLAAVEKAELGGANLHAMAQAGKEYMQYFEISQLQL